MSPEYVEAMKLSYANQESELVVPVAGITEVALGFQPLGIAAKQVTGMDMIAIAAYSEPAICLATVSLANSALKFDVGWIRGVDHNGQSVRLFPPDTQKSGDVYRAQVVMFDAVGNLWVAPNGSREFVVLAPEAPLVRKWQVAGRVVLPGDGAVHSARLEGEILTTVESSGDLMKWSTHMYFVGQTDPQHLQKLEDTPPFVYGGWRPGDGVIWFVTDYRATVPHGIYFAGQLVVPDVCGTGICFFPGGALVSRYGQSHPGAFNGLPGALIYVPDSAFE